MKTVGDERKIEILKQTNVFIDALDLISKDLNLDIGEHLFITHQLFHYSLNIMSALGHSDVDIARMIETYSQNVDKPHIKPFLNVKPFKPSKLSLVKSEDE